MQCIFIVEMLDETVIFTITDLFKVILLGNIQQGKRKKGKKKKVLPSFSELAKRTNIKRLCVVINTSLKDPVILVKCYKWKYVFLLQKYLGECTV